jgi:hypothetical protein
MFQHTRFIEYQVVQSSKTKLTVRAVPSQGGVGTDIEDMKHVRNVLRSHLGDQVEIEWHFVDEIPASTSGKRHFFIAQTGSE